MKVCTDACAFGAWANISNAKRILDIGTGTGLLSVMAAQRNPIALIDAVEIEKDAAEQASENIQNSPFSNQIGVFQTAIQDFNPGYLYDSILINPPFYQNDLRSFDERINQAHHATSLTFDELFESIERLLKNEGAWHVLLPIEESKNLTISAVNRGWVKQNELLLYHSLMHGPFRSMGTFSRIPADNEPNIVEKLAVYESDNPNHTFAFRQLLRDFFYLKF